MDETTYRAPWSPGGQASFEQQHALALDKLRTSHTYYLACISENEEGHLQTVIVAGTRHSTQMASLLLTRMCEQIEPMAETLMTPLTDDELDEDEAA